MYTRCNNVNRKPGFHSDTPHPKRRKFESQKHVYAALDFECDDDVSTKQNTEFLMKEVSKPKPKSTTVKELEL